MEIPTILLYSWVFAQLRIEDQTRTGLIQPSPNLTMSQMVLSPEMKHLPPLFVAIYYIY